MIVDIVVDIGNTRIKWGRVEGQSIVATAYLDHDDAASWENQFHIWHITPGYRWVLTGVVPATLERLRSWLLQKEQHVLHLDNQSLLSRLSTPFTTAVRLPQQIGTDRLLGSLAAISRLQADQHGIVISMGTAITIDFVQAPTQHLGGLILPGLTMMSRSLHEHTVALPAVDVRNGSASRLWGTDTVEAIQLGIAHSVFGSIERIMREAKASCSSAPTLFVTGGDRLFLQPLADRYHEQGWYFDEFLILEGVRIAAEKLI